MSSKRLRKGSIASSSPDLSAVAATTGIPSPANGAGSATIAVAASSPTTIADGAIVEDPSVITMTDAASPASSSSSTRIVTSRGTMIPVAALRPRTFLQLQQPQQQSSDLDRPVSEFDVLAMPRDRIVPRTLHPWSVHHSLTTFNWIATISRPPVNSNGTTSTTLTERPRYLQVPFPNEREARKFCKAFAPPKMVQHPLSGPILCMSCHGTTVANKHCRNCGVTICDGCSSRWGCRMVPKTYLVSSTVTVRVCKACDWLSNAFCMALLQGRYHDALAIHDTGNVNLRTCFADINREAMFPVHCAVMGGNLDLFQWLVDTQMCPIKAQRDPKGPSLSVQTSASRTLLDLAMTGRLAPKVDILVFLIQKGLSIQDVKDPSLASKTLEAILKAGFNPFGAVPRDTAQVVERDGADLGEDITIGSAAVASCSSNALGDDGCYLCCERTMDCVLVPCGHQVCCTECGQQLHVCPVCKASCSVLRIFRQ